MKKQHSNLSTQRALLFFFASLLVVLACVLFGFWLTKRCLILDCPPERNFTVFDMSIPKGYFPEDEFINLHPDRGIYNATEQSFGSSAWINGQVGYRVLKFGTIQQSVEWFNFHSNLKSQSLSHADSMKYQQILIYIPSNADEYKIQCGYYFNKNESNCIFEARYQEFYIFLNSSIGGEMQNQDFVNLMSYIDTRMEKLLNSKNNNFFN